MEKNILIEAESSFNLGVPMRGFFTPVASQVCTKTVMDNTDPDITFDSDGVCSWWHRFKAESLLRPTREQQEIQLKQLLREIRAAGTGREYDCLVGVSGGVDSSYVLHLARKWSLRPLVLHFDNGWNDELAVSNIRGMLKKTGFGLQTFVMNWQEFRDLQRAYFRASVIDLEVPTDHMIFGAMFKTANIYGIRYILSGTNFATERVMPSAWVYSKFDLTNLMGIHKTYGEVPLRMLPRLGVWQKNYYEKIRGIKMVNILDLIPYRKLNAKQLLMGEYGWRDYGGKHYESIFTRFYQGYILPRKYGVDKRKAHLSNLILNGEITRDQAIEALSHPTDDPARQRHEKKYVAKKLGWSEGEFEEILSLVPRPHEAYGTDRRHFELARAAFYPINKISRLVAKVDKFARS